MTLRAGIQFIKDKTMKQCQMLKAMDSLDGPAAQASIGPVLDYPELMEGVQDYVESVCVKTELDPTFEQLDELMGEVIYLIYAQQEIAYYA